MHTPQTPVAPNTQAPIGAPSETPAYRQHVTPLYTAQALAERTRELGSRITQDFAGKDLTVVGVLKGSFLFFADLVRHIDLPLTCEFIGLSSYGDAKSSSGEVKKTSDILHSVAGKHVLIVEDIIDTGLSMQFLLEHFKTRKPASLSVCTLLHKPSGTRVEVPIHYKGFEIGDAFVVGYGLDYHGRLRNLPFVGVVKDGREPDLKAAIHGATGAKENT